MNKKVPIIIIIVLAAFTLLLYIIFKDEIDSNNKPKEYKYLVLDTISTWKYDDNTWSKANRAEILEKQLYKTYVDNEYYGENYLLFGKRWYINDKDDNFVPHAGYLLAYSNGLNINVKQTKISNINEQDINTIQNILGYTIDVNEIYVNEKAMVDLNNDGMLDEIVCVNNIDYNTIRDRYFSLVYANINGNIFEIINNVNLDDLLGETTYNLISFLNFDNSENDNIIIQKSYFSNVGETGNILYSFKDGKYEKIFED